MRNTILFFFILFPLFTKAQTNGKINISATVTSSIELITINPIILENTQPGQLSININPINDLNSGHMIALGTPEAEFRLDYELEKKLERMEGSGYLIFRYELSGNTIDDQSSSDIIQYENRSFNFNNEGRFYIWLGGTLNLENAQPGNYEGDFSIEIDYI